jgi:hypothetical protein
MSGGKDDGDDNDIDDDVDTDVDANFLLQSFENDFEGWISRWPLDSKLLDPIPDNEETIKSSGEKLLLLLSRGFSFASWIAFCNLHVHSCFSCPQVAVNINVCFRHLTINEFSLCPIVEITVLIKPN